MINHEHQPYLSLRDKLSGIFKPSLSKEEFWALKDVSFDVYPGESIGIIGKNGAGKSTLLKILSKITPPTSGKIISRGRIASLLEVGTGFHPELTGRENIYMNGSILGMRRKEIQKNFDAIVDFAGVEKFIDTPLKHYSSGMQLRLAFAVAAFLENEILIIDEVLAVGDAEFQKKCMGKMEDVSKSGRTVLFVSHNMGAVKQLCKSSLLLINGKIKIFDNNQIVIDKYLSSVLSKNRVSQFLEFNNNYFTISKLEIINNVDNLNTLKFDEPIKLVLKIKSKKSFKKVSFGFGVTTFDNIPLFTTRSNDFDLISNEEISFSTSIHHNLRAGIYNITFGVSSGNFSYIFLPDILSFEILNYGIKTYNFNDYGLINCTSNWEKI